ncbi:unnamed protein product, partial [Rhizoctonia solani]
FIQGFEKRKPDIPPRETSTLWLTHSHEPANEPEHSTQPGSSGFLQSHLSRVQRDMSTGLYTGDEDWGFGNHSWRGWRWSCGVNRTVKLWDTSSRTDEEEGTTVSCIRQKFPELIQPPIAGTFEYISRKGGIQVGSFISQVQELVFKISHSAIDHHQLFATASNIVQLWDETKFVGSLPTIRIARLTLQTDPPPSRILPFQPRTKPSQPCDSTFAESSIFATTGTDRILTLYDIRTGKAERRLVMQMRANAPSWSPTFPTTLLVASEDHNLYTFDVRSLSNPTQVYKSHVAA